MSKREDPDARPGLPELIRHTYQTARVEGPSQKEAIELLETFGFDPKMPVERLTDQLIFAVLDRRHAQLH